jgi:O-succinylbenzoate synthase
LAHLKITEFEIFRYDLPLISSVQINNILVKDRAGLLIKIRAEQGCTGIGEISPLPGLHEEDLQGSLMNLKEIIPSLINTEIPVQVQKLENGFENWIGGKKILSSVRFGLEMAVLNMVAESTNQSLGRLLSEDCQEKIEINGLLLGEKDEIIDHAERLVRDGYRRLKMKVGRKSVDQEIQILEELREIINGKAQLRLDVNRRWSFADAVKFASTVGPDNIEYIEEPLEDFVQLNDFFNQTGMPVALDESLSEQSLDQTENIRGVKAFVVKPSVIGGFERSMKLIRYAAAHGIYPIISSAFESGLGIAALVNFAASLRPGNTAMGLDTNRWLATHLLEAESETTEGKLDVELTHQNSKKINYESLRKITNH